jgi:hypothetical protein
MSMTACIDRFSFFNREIQFAGWAFVPDKTIVSIDLFIDDAVVEGTASINCASPDVEAHFGTVAANARFHGNARLPEGTDTPLNAALRFRFSDGTEEIKSEMVRMMSRAVLKFARQASLVDQARRPGLAVQGWGW